MAVNVSTDSLSRVGFPDLVTSYATAAGVPPESVILEVTESRLTDNLAAALDVFNRLRLRRLRLAIDDFGTGHSSLAERRASPFDQLKIDRSFVHGAATDAKRRAIYGGALALGKELQLEVVAEGVEDRTDWDFLLRTGCTLAQGCFIGKPMPAEEIVGWLAKWTMRLSKESLLSPS
jgi:EAL domain-containing protein (putative c-di-GMP-specific phosphodiesterase class I)